MAYDDYEKDVLRTLSLQFNLQNSGGGPHPAPADLATVLERAIAIGYEVDKLKRAIFYGSDYKDGAASPEHREMHVGHDSGGLAHPSPEMIHSALGIFTEAAEFLESIVASTFRGSAFDRTNAIEELGDVEWYMAVMRDRLGISQEKVQRTNIAKLRARYPEKFERSDALDRDHAGERSVLEAELPD